MVDIDDFLVDCSAAILDTEPRRAIRDVLSKAMTDRDAVATALRPETAGITILHRSPEVTIVDVVWAPGMRVFPHDHRMWAAIAVYTGREDNDFFRRRPESPHLLQASDGRTLDAVRRRPGGQRVRGRQPRVDCLVISRRHRAAPRVEPDEVQILNCAAEPPVLKLGHVAKELKHDEQPLENQSPRHQNDRLRHGVRRRSGSHGAGCRRAEAAVTRG